MRTASIKLVYILLRGFRGKREVLDKGIGCSRQVVQGFRRAEQLGEQGYRSWGRNDDVSIAVRCVSTGLGLP
jgi:hypothetical protein